MIKLKTKFKTRSILIVVAIVVVLGLSLVAAYPFSGLFNDKQSELHEAIQSAIENDDYSTWRSLMEEKLSEENFDLIVERHKVMSEKFETKQETMQAIQNAMDAKDYDAWKTAIESNKMYFNLADKITEDNFATFVQLHAAKQSGDFETVKELSSELGFELGAHSKFKQGNFKHMNRFWSHKTPTKLSF